jgi:membrane complex biogenesis BtpA family protein
MERLSLEEMFGVEKPLVGVLHLPPLPGSPGDGPGRDGLRDRLHRDLEALAGVDGVVVENFGDAPFHPGRVPVHTVAFMSVLASEAVSSADVPVGVNVLRNDGEAALAAAEAAGAAFVRVNVWTGARVTDQGIVEGRAHEVLRLRRRLDSRVRVFADVDVKHSAPLGDRPLAGEVRDAVERGGADAVLVTGPSTGSAPDPDRLETARRASDAPVLAASGATPSTAGRLLDRADGLVVGSAMKAGGDPRRPVDRERVRAMVEAVDRARGG